MRNAGKGERVRDTEKEGVLRTMKKIKERKKEIKGGMTGWLARPHRWLAAMGAAQTQGKNGSASVVHYGLLEFWKRCLGERRIGLIEKARREGEGDVIGGG